MLKLENPGTDRVLEVYWKHSDIHRLRLGKHPVDRFSRIFAGIPRGKAIAVSFL